MTPDERVRQAAAFLTQVRLSGKPADGLPAACAPADLPEAYAVQTALNESLARQGLNRVVGYKIGCTTAVMQ